MASSTLDKVRSIIPVLQRGARGRQAMTIKPVTKERKRRRPRGNGSVYQKLRGDQSAPGARPLVATAALSWVNERHAMRLLLFRRCQVLEHLQCKIALNRHVPGAHLVQEGVEFCERLAPQAFLSQVTVRGKALQTRVGPKR